MQSQAFSVSSNTGNDQKIVLLPVRLEAKEHGLGQDNLDEGKSHYQCRCHTVVVCSNCQQHSFAVLPLLV